MLVAKSLSNGPIGPKDRADASACTAVAAWEHPAQIWEASNNLHDRKGLLVLRQVELHARPQDRKEGRPHKVHAVIRTSCRRNRQADRPSDRRARVRLVALCIRGARPLLDGRRHAQPGTSQSRARPEVREGGPEDCGRGRVSQATDGKPAHLVGLRTTADAGATHEVLTKRRAIKPRPPP